MEGPAKGTGLRWLWIAAVLAACVAALPAWAGSDAADAATANRIEAADRLEARGPVTNLPLPRYVSLRANLANVRRGPATSHRIDWQFRHRNMPLRVTAEYGHWRRVEDWEGQGGWVHHALLSGVRTVVVAAEDGVVMRASPLADAMPRALAEPGVVARLHSCTDGWCRIQVDGHDGWVPAASLWGIGPRGD